MYRLICLFCLTVSCTVLLGCNGNWHRLCLFHSSAIQCGSVLGGMQRHDEIVSKSACRADNNANKDQQQRDCSDDNDDYP